MPRRTRDPFPTRLPVLLTPELTARVYRAHRESGLGGPPADTAQELISAALEYPEVADALLRSARLRAFATVRRDFWHLVGGLLGELDSTWHQQRDRLNQAEPVPADRDPPPFQFPF
jgi:hypothetical protein